jgi:hypothetical protein
MKTVKNRQFWLIVSCVTILAVLTGAVLGSWFAAAAVVAYNAVLVESKGLRVARLAFWVLTMIVLGIVAFSPNASLTATGCYNVTLAVSLITLAITRTNATSFNRNEMGLDVFFMPIAVCGVSTLCAFRNLEHLSTIQVTLLTSMSMLTPAFAWTILPRVIDENTGFQNWYLKAFICMVCPIVGPLYVLQMTKRKGLAKIGGGRTTQQSPISLIAESDESVAK